MARRRAAATPLSLSMDMMALGWEASTVIGLRMMMLAAGGARAEAEALRMVEEKVAAAADLQFRAMTGGLGHHPVAVGSASVARLRRAVRANARRLRTR